MSLIRRFTRDEASKFVWSALMLAALVGVVLSISAGGRAVEQERRSSQARAVADVERVIAPRLDSSELMAPLSGPALQRVQGAVEESIMSDPRVERLRIWSANGSLLFSTAKGDHPGSHAALNDELVREAWRGTVITRTNLSDTGGLDDHERSLLRTYVPLASTAVVEVDQTDEGTLGPVRTEWLSYQLLAGGLALLFLVITALSLRDPIERINGGVPFAASSIPAGYSLIDDDRLHAVREVYRLASERVQRLEEKLSESEEARRRLEGDIQRTLSKAATSAGKTKAPAASQVAPPAPPPAAAAPERPVVQVPESEVVRSPLGGKWSEAPAGPLARATRDDTPAPRVKPAEKTKRALRRKKAAAEKPAREKSPRDEPRRETPRREQPRPQPARQQQPAPEPAPPKIPPEIESPREVVAVGAKSKVPPAEVATDIDDAKAHAAALETFIRLTESDRQPHEDEVDQGAVRAALARTAARKKPGGDKLRPHDAPPGESPGGPPRDRA
jgi:hypothetical protein